MQHIKFYVAAPQTLGVVRDYANAKNASVPTLVRGCEVCLKMRLFANADGNVAYPIESFANIVKWQWAMDKDFNNATSYILEADNNNITVSTVTDTVDETDVDYTEFSIPISSTNTEELATWLGTEKSKAGLAGELVGFNAEATQVFVLQVENFTVRNRITSLGTPTPISPDYLTAAQVCSLIAAGIVVRYSEDGDSDWHDTQTTADRYICVRSASDANAVWSDAIALVVGPTGAKGDDSYCYTAYASDSVGTSFSLTPTNALKYRAEIHVSEAIAELSAIDFSGAKWIKYLGDDGTGIGDMLKSIYDNNNDGIVDNATHAHVADAAPWTGITDKPEAFVPSAHTHLMAAITDTVRQKVASESNPTTLYLDSPILINSSEQSATTISLNFTKIKTKAVDGTEYTGAPGDCLTWEYHVTCTNHVNGITCGSLNSTMVGITIPGILPLINSAPTTHVFAIRGLYDAEAINQLRLQANYAYSFEA